METVLGLLGVAGLILLATSFRNKKSGGEDRRFKKKTGRALLGLACWAIAILIAMMM